MAEPFIVGANPAQGNGRVELRPNEEAVWRWLDNAAKEAERVRRSDGGFDSLDRYLDLYYGKHWPTTLPSFRPPVVANELRTLILSEASDLTESQLRIYITKDPRRGDRDQQVERAFHAIWTRQQVDLKLMFASVWALIAGTGFLDVGWDPDAAHGMGDVTVEARDPRTVLPDPDAVDDHKWLFRIIEEVLDIQEIRRLFPLSGYRVRPEDEWSLKDPHSSPTSPSTPSYLGPLTTADSLASGILPGYKKARARVLDCVLLDPAVETAVEEVKDSAGEPIKDENGNPILREELRPKYPSGRRIVGANGTILYDGDNNHPAGDFGLLRVVLEPTLGRFWGTGFVQQTAELQLAADKLLSNIVENSIRLNNGVVVATANTGLDWESFAGIPAQIVTINPGSEFKIQYPPPMPPDMVQAPWRMLDLQRRLLGFQDARGGMPSKGNVSADLTETEISQAQSPTRLRARILYYTVQRLAEMIFARMAKNYTTTRSIPAVENEKFSPVEWKPLDNPEKYAVYVDPASFTIMSRTMLRRLGIALYKLRAIDRSALLERIGWPDWEETAKRLDQADKLAAMAKMAGKKGGGSSR